MIKVLGHIISSCVSTECRNILLIFDDTTEGLRGFVEKAAERMHKRIESVKIPCGERHGEEPSPHVLKRMMQSDTIMCLTKYSLAHTEARKITASMGIPFLSMPDYNFEMLQNPALMVDYKKAYCTVNRYSQMLTEAKEIAVYSEYGTKLFLSVRGRKGNCCPGWTDREHLLGSPPDIEANISPIETYTHGTVVIDGSITDDRIGLLDTAVCMKVENGVVTDIECKDRQIEQCTKEILQRVNSSKAYVIGEFGIGFNDKALLCGNMLIDEGTLGCIHFGMGSNWTIGGNNRIDFHLDFVMRDATILFDNNIVIERGKLLYE